jgi:hypothetical protein
VVSNAPTSQHFFGYDADGLLTCASSTSCNPVASDALTLAYDPDNGLLTDIDLGNLSESIAYTSLGELASQTATFGASPLFSETYDDAVAPRDALGRITRKTERLLGV